MPPITVASEMAIVALCDPSVTLPSSRDQAELLRALETLAQEARVFYLVTDDPVHYRIELLVGEALSSELAREFEPCGGTFGLELPTGRLALQGWTSSGSPEIAGALDANPGRQVVSVLGHRPFEGPRHVQEMAALLGNEWSYMERVNRLGLLGCLPLALLVISLVLQKWQWLWFVLPLLAVSWLPYMILKHGRHYRAAERKAAEVERARPHYVFSVMPTEHRDLAGGFLRV
jgi:hypothetical protein